ncbi:MAG: alpha/beta hydrolase [Deltaproteobacteria bacterium]|nr:alpha/beta hydrolase [Deltaproteobacteria bacterium]
MTTDPALFSPAAVDAETAAFNAALEQQLAQLPPLTNFPPRVIRAARESGQGPFGPLVRVEWASERTIAGPAGPLALRLFIPERVNAVYLHLHGGGFMLGSARQQDPLLAAIATDCAVAVVSVDYRLAPEHPYPGAVDDCEAAALWLARHGRAEFGTARLLIGGESAGANLAALTLLRMRDRHGFCDFAAANLTFGVFDLSLTPSAARWGERNLILNTAIIEWFNQHYIAAERRRESGVSPLYADLSQLPPALFTVGTLDPLLDDSLFMHSRWLAAGNTSELAIYPGGVHAFTAFPITLGRRANARIREFIAEHSRPAPAAGSS